MNLESGGQFGDYQNEIYLGGLSGVLPTMPMAFDELEARAQATLSPSLLSYVAGGAGDGRPHARGGGGPLVAQDAGVVVEHLREHVTPEPAQPLAAGQHPGSTPRRLIRRPERPRLHTPMVVTTSSG